MLSIPKETRSPEQLAELNAQFTLRNASLARIRAEVEKPYEIWEQSYGIRVAYDQTTQNEIPEKLARFIRSYYPDVDTLIDRFDFNFYIDKPKALPTRIEALATVRETSYTGTEPQNVILIGNEVARSSQLFFHITDPHTPMKIRPSIFDLRDWVNNGPQSINRATPEDLHPDIVTLMAQTINPSFPSGIGHHHETIIKTPLEPSLYTTLLKQHA